MSRASSRLREVKYVRRASHNHIDIHCAVSISSSAVFKLSSINTDCCRHNTIGGVSHRDNADFGIFSQSKISHLFALINHYHYRPRHLTDFHQCPNLLHPASSSLCPLALRISQHSRLLLPYLSPILSSP
jgi:hypothetical protein